TFVRAPWGAPISEHGARFEVLGRAGAVAAEATVRLESSSGVPLASVRADATGTFTGLRTFTDVAGLFLRQIDQAGNLGPAARVRDVVWTASLGGKRALSTDENPHRLGELSFAGQGRSSSLEPAA